MRHSNFEHELSLLLLLAENRSLSVPALASRLAMSERTIYYYIEAFRAAGFRVERREGCYKLDKESPFFAKLFRRVRLTDAEADALVQLLDGLPRPAPHFAHIRDKLAGLHDLAILNPESAGPDTGECVEALYDAIRREKLAVLHDYASPHSGRVGPRIVEPYMFLDSNADIRCYEPSTATNKTFKIARIGRVEVLSDDWQHADKHRRVYTDLFMFSGEERHHVCLNLGLLARNLLVEERPAAARHITPISPTRFRLELDVCSYAGIARFAMGLMDDIEIVADDGLRQYLRQKADNAKARLDVGVS